MGRAIQQAIDADSLNAHVVIHTGLVADYCAEQGIRWYVRGLRGSADYTYEEGNARVNKLLNPSLETLYLRGDDRAVSSSMVRELMAFGKDVGAFVPAPVWHLLQQQP
jgi:pantetheine-phosphate adenylyltransferase